MATDLEDRMNKLAYGKWYTEDGREVYFNRRYKPIWIVFPDGDEGPPFDKDERFKILSQEWFYNDSTFYKA